MAGAVLFAAFALAACSGSQTKTTADLIVTRAKVWTGDESFPAAEAVAVVRDRIVAVGSAAEIARLRAPRTRLIDAGGKLLLPGFNDAHVHFVEGGRQLDNVDLRDASSPAEFSRRIGERVRATPAGEWIEGGDWDEQRWDSPVLPTRHLIDPVSPSTPVFVIRYDGHMGLANSAALRLAGISAKTADPPGGTVVRDETGEPTGILKDAAMGYVNKVIPPLSREKRLRAARRALEHAATLGVTSVQDMGPAYEDVSLYAALAEKGELTTRIYAAPSETHWEDQARLGVRHAFGSPFLRIGAVKGFADGSLGSGTAYFFEPYSDVPASRGLLSDEMQPPAEMLTRLTEADRAGLQLCIHAIGDQAISMVLDMFEAIGKANGPSERRCRIEHAQHMAPKDFQRFATLNVVASVQPYHAADDGRWAEKRIGPERAKTTYPFRTFLDHKIPVAFGTDWYVAPLDPMLTLHAAVTRATTDGKHPYGWIPEQKIGIVEAVSAYTKGSAYAEFQEHEKGTISAGKLADMVLLDTDIFSVPPEAIKDVKVAMTIVGGKPVFTR